MKFAGIKTPRKNIKQALETSAKRGSLSGSTKSIIRNGFGLWVNLDVRPKLAINKRPRNMKAAARIAQPKPTVG